MLPEQFVKFARLDLPFGMDLPKPTSRIENRPHVHKSRGVGFGLSKVTMTGRLSGHVSPKLFNQCSLKAKSSANEVAVQSNQRWNDNACVVQQVTEKTTTNQLCKTKGPHGPLRGK